MSRLALFNFYGHGLMLNRVVIFQGQYGIFKRANLDLSMPAIQTCIGLYAVSDQHDYLLCAHFDSAIRLKENLEDIKNALKRKNINLSSFRATVFGGDGFQSFLRCSFPSTYIGYEVIRFIREQGGHAEYSHSYYSGVIPRTFNFYYNQGCGVREGINPVDFSGYNHSAREMARKRVTLRPAEYSSSHARMIDASQVYSEQ